MIQTLVIYIGLLLIMFAFARYSAKVEQLNPIPPRIPLPFDMLIPALLFAGILALRYIDADGNDYSTYLGIFKYGANEYNDEPGFQLLVESLRAMNVHFTTYFFCLGFLEIAFLYMAFKDQRFLLPTLILMLFVGNTFITWQNVIRQSIACCIFIYSTKFIDKREPWKYLLFCLLAASFHKTAIILPLLYFLFVKRDAFFTNIWIQILVVFAAFIIKMKINTLDSLYELVNTIGPLIGYENYNSTNAENLTFDRKSWIGPFIFMLIDLILVCFSKKMREYYNSRYFNIAYTLFFIGLIAHMLFAGLIIFYRPFMYFIMFKMVIEAYFLHYCYSHLNHINFLSATTYFSIHFLYFIYYTIYNCEANNTIFTFYWQVPGIQ